MRLCTARWSIPEVEAINKGYASRILRLALLAPDVVEAILVGRTDQALVLEELERRLAANRDERRAVLRPAGAVSSRL